MLTRLRVRGFKNLANVDLRFGPFTCIAGANGVGKSNLFDAISFLSALASKSLMDAALSVRDEGARFGDIRSLFHHVGGRYAAEMSFDVEMIIPHEGIDDLGQRAEATTTFVEYGVTIRRREDDGGRSLELVREVLTHIKLREAPARLCFPNDAVWRKSTVSGRRGTPYFSTDSGIIRVHQDGGSHGRWNALLAASLPRTALSVTNAAESPTATLARREMQSWRLLQLEPSALRRPDDFAAPARLGQDGAHLAATLYRLAQRQNGNGASSAAGRAYGEIANTLAELIDDVRDVRVEKDDKRELLTLLVRGRDGTSHPARALSDGTLRFLALAVLQLDPENQGLLCLEEPENGIHPDRIPAMIRLLEDLSVDTSVPVGPENPLRQVIINTHSPGVVMEVPDDSLLLAELIETEQDGLYPRVLSFACMSETWRDEHKFLRPVSKGRLLAYLNPVIMHPVRESSYRRVVDRQDIHQYSLFGAGKK